MGWEDTSHPLRPLGNGGPQHSVGLVMQWGRQGSRQGAGRAVGQAGCRQGAGSKATLCPSVSLYGADNEELQE